MNNIAQDNGNFPQQLGWLIESINRLRRRFITEKLGPYRLKGLMHAFLLTLDHYPGASQDFLAEHFLMDKGNVAKFSKSLEELGFIRRQIDPGNRRQYQLFLTDSGREMLVLVRKHLDEWNRQLTAGFDEKEREAVLSLLDRMEKNGKAYFEQE